LGVSVSHQSANHKAIGSKAVERGGHWLVANSV
jgi:hypothetical protein